VWCSLRTVDAIQTSPHTWIQEDAVMTGRCQVKGGKTKDWVIANYSIGDRAWMMRWYQLILVTPPMVRDFLIPNYTLNHEGAPQWDTKQLQPSVLQDMYKQMMRDIAMDAPSNDREEAIKWAEDSTLHWLRSAVPTMGGLKNHRDRAIRFQGGWTINSPMTDHYTRAKLGITLGMVGSLVKDLKAGWRPGLEVDPRLIPRQSNPAAVADIQEASDSDGEDAMLSSSCISFYKIKQTKSDGRMPELMAHVPDDLDPMWPACKRLRNRGIRIDDMEELGVFPTSADKICKRCRDLRPEIVEQLEDSHVFGDDTV